MWEEGANGINIASRALAVIIGMRNDLWDLKVTIDFNNLGISSSINRLLDALDEIKSTISESERRTDDLSDLFFNV